MYYLVSISTNIFDILVTFMFFDSFLGWKNIDNKFKFLLGVFMFTATFISNITITNSILSIAINIIILLIVTSGFEGKISKKMLIAVVYMLLILVSDVILTMITINFFNNDVNTLLHQESNARMINMIISKPILLVLVKITSMFVNKKDIQIYKKCGLAMLTIPIINIVLLLTVIYIFDAIELKDITYVCVFALCILYNTILTFYLFEHIAGMVLLKNKCDILENQIIIQAEQVRYNETDKNIIKSFRHDLKIHFQSLYQMLIQRHYDKAREYLEDTGLVKDISEKSVHTGNIALDAIISNKVHEANELDINTKIMCTVPQDLMISDIDICVLFGNLLDNAIESCQRAENSDKEIEIYIKYDRNRLICCIKNTSESEVKKNGDVFVTSKDDGDEHGIGIYNIKKVVLKYDGICKMSKENGYFRVYMTLFL